MSVHATTQTPASSAQPAYDSGYDGDRGYGWVVFAGVLLLIVGTLNLIEGLAAVGNAHFFTANPDYIAGSLSAWGWSLTILALDILAIYGLVAYGNKISSLRLLLRPASR